MPLASAKKLKTYILLHNWQLRRTPEESYICRIVKEILSLNNLGELKIDDYDEELVVDAMIRSEASGYHYLLGEEDFRAILGYMKV